MFSRVLHLIVGLFLILLMISLCRTLWYSWRNERQLEQERQQVELLEQEVREQEQKVYEATSSYELERRVRDELHQKKEGEKVIQIN